MILGGIEEVIDCNVRALAGLGLKFGRAMYLLTFKVRGFATGTRSRDGWLSRCHFRLFAQKNLIIIIIIINN